MIFDATARPDRRVGEYPGGVSSNYGGERPPVFFGGPQNGGFAYYREPTIKKLKFTDKISRRIALALIARISRADWFLVRHLWEYNLVEFIFDSSLNQCERDSRGTRLWGPRGWHLRKNAYLDSAVMARMKIGRGKIALLRARYEAAKTRARP